MQYEVWKPEKFFRLAKFLPILLLNLALISSIPSANAQSSGTAEPNGTITGTVLSQGDNRTLSQVAVRLKSHEAGVFHSILTDYDGHFEVAGLVHLGEEFAVAALPFGRRVVAADLFPLDLGLLGPFP